MPLTNCKKYNGDTLIEVLFAIAVFSLVAVGSLSIMNQGAATAQRAFEITLVRNEIDAQAETLRFLNASYIAAYGGTYAGPALEWKTISDIVTSGNVVSAFGANSGTCPKVHSNGSFVLNTHRALYVAPSGTGTLRPADSIHPLAQVNYDNNDVVNSVNGIWIEAVKFTPSDNTNYQASAGYIDFHIRACWDSPGQSAPVTLGTIVRLYEPR